MQVSYSMNVDDYRAFNMIVLKNNRSGFLRRFGLVLLAFIWLVFLIALLPSTRGQEPSAFPVELLILSIFLTFLWLFKDRIMVWFIVMTQSPEDRAKMAITRFRLDPKLSTARRKKQRKDGLARYSTNRAYHGALVFLHLESWRSFSPKTRFCLGRSLPRLLPGCPGLLGRRTG
jgi:hypothetical protein